MGWSCTGKEMDAIQRLSTSAWTAGIDQNGDTVPDTSVTDLTGLLDLETWHDKIPGLRIIVRNEPLHPRYRKRATEREKQLGLLRRERLGLVASFLSAGEAVDRYFMQRIAAFRDNDPD